VRIDIITIFPEYFSPLSVSLLGKAASRGAIDLHVHDLRQWTHDTHRTVDDAPFGGGPGMVMSPVPWGAALDDVLGPGGEPGVAGAAGGVAPPALGGDAGQAAGVVPEVGAVAPPGLDREAGHVAGVVPEVGAVGGVDPGPSRLVVPTPSGTPFSQATAASLSRCGRLIFACGRYEGIDARFVDEARERIPVAELSIGDYVLSGGEPAVLVMIDAIGRLLPGVLGNAGSAADDSFGGGAGPMSGLLEGPAYTRPRVWRGREVPPVLLSGDHAAIARWRRDEALRRTAAFRPDLAARLVAESADESQDDQRGASGAGAAVERLDSRDREVLIDAGFPISAEDMAH
jgi:tRNA (guanine37-N1)-methyltransferase